MKLVELSQDESLVVQCKVSVDGRIKTTGLRNVVDTARRACSAFRIKSIVIMLNEQVIQVDQHGIVPPPKELQTKE